MTHRKLKAQGGLLTLVLLAVSPSVGHPTAHPDPQAALLYIGDHPRAATPSWGDDYGSTNGIANDGEHWYFSQTSTAEPPLRTWTIWRVPVGIDINQDFTDNPSILRVTYENVPALAGYSHAGDIDCANGYVFVPLTGGTNDAPIVAAFSTESLGYVGRATLPGPDIGWCAARDGSLYTSNDDTDHIRRDLIVWDLIDDDAFLVHQTTYPLLTTHRAPLRLRHMQGGAFSSDGSLLYISCGILECCVIGFCFGEQLPTDGLHVFETQGWTEVATSVKATGFGYTCCPAHFVFDFENDCTADEPEGLAFWNADGSGGPMIEGQLHVVLFHHGNPANPGDPSRVSIKHYSGSLFVASTAPPPPPKDRPIPSNEPLMGTRVRPFNTISNALSWYVPLWRGATLAIAPGSYSERATIATRIRLISTGGLVRIGD